jgi:hypothetical protein
VSDRLAERNRRLRGVHAQLARLVVGLMDTDLARRRDRWAAGVKEMRAVFARLEAEGFSRDSQARRGGRGVGGGEAGGQARRTGGMGGGGAGR